MSSPAAVAADLSTAIEACGYFPTLIADAVGRGLGGEDVRGFCLQLEPTFTLDQIHRHLTVLVLTPSRLVVVHTDEAPSSSEGPTHHAPQSPPQQQAILSTESIGLSSITAVALTTAVADPAGWRPGSAGITEAWLALGWGTMRRIELEPAGCEDPQCTADHGFTGSLSSDDLTLRVSEAADGREQLDRLIELATLLQQATGRASAGARR